MREYFLYAIKENKKTLKLGFLLSFVIILLGIFFILKEYYFILVLDLFCILIALFLFLKYTFNLFLSDVFYETKYSKTITILKRQQTKQILYFITLIISILIVELGIFIAEKYIYVVFNLAYGIFNLDYLFNFSSLFSEIEFIAAVGFDFGIKNFLELLFYGIISPLINFSFKILIFTNIFRILAIVINKYIGRYKKTSTAIFSFAIYLLLKYFFEILILNIINLSLSDFLVILLIKAILLILTIASYYALEYIENKHLNN